MIEVSHDKFNDAAHRAHKIVLLDASGETIGTKHVQSGLYFLSVKERVCPCGKSTYNESGFCSDNCISLPKRRMGFYE